METQDIDSRINRFKRIWRILLISNLALGAYMFAKAAMARKKNSSILDNKPTKMVVEHAKSEPEPAVSSAPIAAAIDYEEYEPPILPVVEQPAEVLEPIPEDQQRELFNWILEDKRKVKAKDSDERKRIDEEKAVLKRFIRAESLPRI